MVFSKSSSASWLLLLLGASACGGAPAAGAPGVTSTGRDPLLSEVEQKAKELDEELARLETRKDGEPPQQGQQPDTGAEGGPGGSPPASPTPEEPAAAPEAPSDARKTAEYEHAPASPRERCRTACRALESMQRVTNRICEIVGEGNERCSWARAQLRDAADRVQRAGCVCRK